jgi:hypothetical protein
VLEWVEAARTSVAKQNFLRCLILDQEKIRMKFHKGLIISGETMHRDKIFLQLVVHAGHCLNEGYD